MTAIISRNLKRLRSAKKLTQEQTAEALGVSAQTVSRWECASSLPDVTLLPQIARLYGVTVDDLFKDTAAPYTNYASRLGSIFEATLAPEDFLRADAEYRRLLDAGEESAEDLRLYGILYQQMIHVCIQKAGALFDRVLSLGPEQSGDIYWGVRRQKGYFLWEIGRNRENIEEFLPSVSSGSDELQEWICLIQAYSFDEDLENAWKWAQKAAENFQKAPFSTSTPAICCGR